MNRLICLVLALFTSMALADTPVGPMNYQGRLLNNGIPVGYPTPTTVNFVVKVYDAASGGSLKYQETHNGVTVDDGVYNFLVGTKTQDAGTHTWSVELWNCCANLYMEITANGEVLLPRSRLAAAPYAFQANLALTTNNALALGGKSATEYDNTLASICVAGKGKWLEKVNKCLGVGSSFPGPTLASWYTMTASNDFTDLDLTRADISGINFGTTGAPSGANLTGTLLKETTYAVASMNGANLTKTYWDGAIATDTVATTVFNTTTLTDVTMKNMDLSKWGFSSVITNPKGFSAAYLSACPASIFPNGSYPWQCKLMRATGTTYFMVGPWTNFSTTSAAAITSNGEVTLDVDDNAFDAAWLREANLVGVTLTQSFAGGYLYGSNMQYSKLKNSAFSPSNLTLVKLGNSTWDNVSMPAGITMNLTDFTGARLLNVKFSNNPGSLNFTGASLKQVDFDGTSGLGSGNFTDAVLENVRFSQIRGTSTVFDNTRIHGDFHIAALNATDVPSMIFKDVAFYGANLSGAFTSLVFTNTITFKYSVFKNLDLCKTSFPLASTAPHPELGTVKWEGLVECPDGTDVAGSSTLYSGTCNHLTRMTPGTTCTAGIPGTLQ